MCGFAGYIDFRGSTSEEALKHKAKEINACIAYRGPDSSGEWVDASCGVALGHRRLSILDLSLDGHQPMVSASGRYVIAYNGEVYNYEELKKNLKKDKASYKGHSDTEVILASIEEKGLTKSVNTFNGMFAFSLWDREQRKLYLVRDRLGIKPLYYAETNKHFIWGSELKPLMKSGFIDKEIDMESLGQFFKYNRVPAPRSIFKGVYKLLPGAILEFDLEKKNSKVEKFWNPIDIFKKGIENTFEGTAEEAINKLEGLLDSAVGMRMAADVPLGAFLSGGVDSSLIVATMQKLSSNPIKSFSIGFEEEQFNEAEHAKAVAVHLGTDHTEMYVTEQDALNVIPDLPNMWDEPFADSSQIPTYLVSKMTKQHVTVALSGDGGDELFGGYKRYHTADAIWKKLNKIPYPIRNTTSKLLNSVPDLLIEKSVAKVLTLLKKNALLSKLPKSLKGSAVHYLSSESLSDVYDQQISHWKNRSNLLNNHKILNSDLFQKIPHRNNIEQMMGYDLMTYLPDDILTKVDRASMMSSLEARVPLLDYRIVEYAWQLPFELKVSNGNEKHLLKELLYRNIPKRLIDRPKKGFGVPLGSWLRGPLKEWSQDLISENELSKHGLLNNNIVTETLKKHLNKEVDAQHYLWDILMFQSWYNKWNQ